MSYLALYRQFRPTTFEEVIGQDSIVTTLKNQIRSNRIGHAYLFCGARGTGKTTCARIFAKAVNCLQNKGGSPCCNCEICSSFKDGSNVDIIEIDAASNNSVDNIRELREKVQYTPVKCKYKVYIIDEVHMLTSGAFNALLKTLEEPPKHAIFILATTEVHKLPQTILSRCMRFDFKLVPTKEIASYVAKVYDNINKKYEAEAVLQIAKAGEGSVRDALSIADMCISTSSGKLTYKDVLEVLGATDISQILNLIKDILCGKTGEVFSSIDRLVESGKAIGVLNRDVINALRDLAVLKSCNNFQDILSLPDSALEEYKNVASLVEDEHTILRALEIFSGVENALRFSNQPRIVFENACLKASMPSQDYNLDAILSRLSALENRMNSDVVLNTPKVENNSIEQAKFNEIKEETVKLQEEVKEIAKTVDKPKVERVIADTVEKPTSQSSTNVQNMSAGKVWGNVLKILRKNKNMFLWISCQELQVKLNGNVLSVICNEDSEYELLIKNGNMEIIKEALTSVGDYKLEIIKKGMAVQENNALEDDIEKLKNMLGSDLIIK